MIKVGLILWMMGVVALSLIETSLAAEGQKKIDLECIYQRTYDETAKKFSPTSGSKLITVFSLGHEMALLRKEGLGAEYSGKISDKEIEGQTSYDNGGIKIHQRLIINRYTSQMEDWFTINGKSLIHYGFCHPVTKKF